MAVQFPLRSRWWRFDEYQVTQGHIMPSPGAKLVDYDPFALYRATWDREGKAKRRSLGNHPAYVELMHLAGRPHDHNAIEQWCSKHGLLGLLQFRLVRLVHQADDAMQVVESPQRREVHMELDEMIMDSLAKPARALFFTATGDIADRSPVETLKPYFPSIEVSKFSTGHLLWGLGAHGSPDDEVLRDYAEPVNEFIDAANQLKEVFRTLTRVENDWPRRWASELLPPDYVRALSCAWEDLSWNDEAWLPRWRFSSLLAALYTMMRLDVGGGKLMRYCRRLKCGMPFITDNVQQHYCSVQCVKAEEKARERGRNRYLRRRVKEEFERVLSHLKSRYPDATPEKLYGELRKCETGVTDRVTIEVKREYPLSYEASLCDHGIRVWESLMDEVGVRPRNARGPA
ncbi:MAG: hypothetical protein Q8P50_06880 [Bacillota bacterium]|nr:hypothetical protein [Bacillota bacterium]